jgi:hypothetical protein
MAEKPTPSSTDQPPAESAEQAPPASVVAGATAAVVADGVQITRAASQKQVGTAAVGVASLTSDAFRLVEIISQIPGVANLKEGASDFVASIWSLTITGIKQGAEIPCVQFPSLPWCADDHAAVTPTHTHEYDDGI